MTTRAVHLALPRTLLLTLLAGLVLTSSPGLASDPALAFLRGTLEGASFETSFPTAITMGPDGRLYVADREGRIQALTLDGTGRHVVAVDEIATDADLQEVYGMAFDPGDAAVPPPLYVSNTISGFGDTGAAPAGEFSGKVTKLHGPGHATHDDVITGLPVSSSSHQTNGLAFDAAGVLYLAQGSTTNAGVPNTAGSGFLGQEEVPLSSSVLVADLSAPGFDGTITHDPPSTYGHTVDQTGGDVSVFAAGFRNPYDLLFHSNGKLYLTDNGPNAPFGRASIDCTTDTGAGVDGPDELNIVVAGGYYGHANRNRGRTDPRQCTYHSGTEPSSMDHTAPIALLPSSSNGIVEYTSTAFCSALLGDLLYVAYNLGTLQRVVLAPDGCSTVSDTVLASDLELPLDVTHGPTGIVYVAEYGASRITFLEPWDCRDGNVNARAGAVTDVLFANGGTGTDPEHEVNLGLTDPLTVNVVSPPSRPGQNTRFCVWARLGGPTSATVRELPQGIGTTCVQNELSGGTSNRRSNSLGYNGLLGADDWPGPPLGPAPVNLLVSPGGIGFPVTFTLQGILLDSGSFHGTVGVTNVLVIVVQ